MEKMYRVLLANVSEEFCGKLGVALKQTNRYSVVGSACDGVRAISLLKELKGGFNAFFYQIAAKSFKLDLKSDFNPETNIYDQYIEEIVQMLDSGRI